LKYHHIDLAFGVDANCGRILQTDQIFFES
jgi:hypothetical protein